MTTHKDNQAPQPTLADAVEALNGLRDAGLTDTFYAKAKAAHSKTHEADFYDAGQGKLNTRKSTRCSEPAEP